MEVTPQALEALNGTILGEILNLIGDKENLDEFFNDPVAEGEEVITKLLPHEVACRQFSYQQAEKAKALLGQEGTVLKVESLTREAKVANAMFWAMLRSRDVKLAEAAKIGIRKDNQVVVVPVKGPHVTSVTEIPGVGMMFSVEIGG